MKKAILTLMLAGSIAALEACNTGSGVNGGVDSVKNADLPPSNIDTSKTVSTMGGATVLDYTASGGVTVPKGKASARTTMNAPVAAAVAPVAAVDTTKKDTVKK